LFYPLSCLAEKESRLIAANASSLLFLKNALREYENACFSSRSKHTPYHLACFSITILNSSHENLKIDLTKKYCVNALKRRKTACIGSPNNGANSTLTLLLYETRSLIVKYFDDDTVLLIFSFNAA
jgi:hypothetical protein